MWRKILICMLIVITTSYSKDYPFAIDFTNSMISENIFENKLFLNLVTKYSNLLGIGIKYYDDKARLIASLYNRKNDYFYWQYQYVYAHPQEGTPFMPMDLGFEVISNWGFINYNQSNYIKEEINIAYYNYKFYYNPFESLETRAKGLHLMPIVSLNSAIKNINLGEVNYKSLGKQALNSHWGFEGGLSTDLKGFHNSYLHWEFEADANIFLSKSNIIFYNFNYELFLNLTYLLKKQTKLSLEEFSVSLGTNYQWAELEDKTNEIYSLYLRLYYHFPYKMFLL